jgi:hypothetical protein
VVTQPPPIADLEYLLQFAKHVRRFAAGHARGGLGGLHQEAGEAIRRIERLQAETEPAQLPLERVEA